MKRRHVPVAAAILVLVAAVARPASAFDAEKTFAKGTVVLSAEGSYGWQFNLEGFNDWTKLEFWNLGVRGSILPFNPTGIKGKPLYGSLEIGLEPVYQRYTDPEVAKDAFWAGLAVVLRYHFISLGRVVPYVEVVAGVGGTDLNVREIRSDYSFLLCGGVGASVFLTDSAAVYAGYRYEHNSNGSIVHGSPNRGWESNVAVVGVSYYLH